MVGRLYCWDWPVKWMTLPCELVLCLETSPIATQRQKQPSIWKQSISKLDENIQDTCKWWWVNWKSSHFNPMSILWNAECLGQTQRILKPKVSWLDYIWSWDWVVSNCLPLTLFKQNKSLVKCHSFMLLSACHLRKHHNFLVVHREVLEQISLMFVYSYFQVFLNGVKGRWPQVVVGIVSSANICFWSSVFILFSNILVLDDFF